jgi:hypothetical protein
MQTANREEREGGQVTPPGCSDCFEKKRLARKAMRKFMKTKAEEISQI